MGFLKNGKSEAITPIAVVIAPIQEAKEAEKTEKTSEQKVEEPNK